MSPSVVLITGCSSGIGRDLASRLARSGHTVVATARQIETLDQLQVPLKLLLDVTNQESVDQAVRETLQRFGRIDVLVNNAGWSVRSAVEDLDETKARAMFEVNVWGLLRVSRAVLPQMRRRGSGRIINVGSVVGKMTFPINGAYSASKHAVEALSDAMRLELKNFGISVVLVEPGTVDSRFMATSEAHGSATCLDPSSPYAPLYQEFYRLAAAPTGKGADPDRVSRVIQRAIEVRTPNARYLAAVSPLFRITMHSGDRLRDWILERVFRIHAPRPETRP